MGQDGTRVGWDEAEPDGMEWDGAGQDEAGGVGWEET